MSEAQIKGAEKTVPCKWCKNPTRMLGTKECDQCWEVRSAVQHNPRLARRVLDAIKEGKVK